MSRISIVENRLPLSVILLNGTLLFQALAKSLAAVTRNTNLMSLDFYLLKIDVVYSPINTATMMEEQEEGGESDNENHGVTSIISPDEMLKIGLRLAGFTRLR
jgi:hypothetical protein